MLFALDLGRVFSESLTQALGPQAVVFALAAIGLNIHFGYTGLLNFGHIGFLATGAYGTAIAITHFGWPALFAILFGLFCSACLALILGIPTLRLRADYLAIVTIGAAEIIRLLARSTAARPLTGGAQGLNNWVSGLQAVNPWDRQVMNIGPLTYRGNQIAVVVFGWIAVAIITYGVYRLMSSPWGRVLKAIREDEDAVRALGKNVYSFKMQSLVLGGVIAGLGGFVGAFSNSTVQPDVYVPTFTFFVWAALILGGAARVFSPIVGSIIFWFFITFFESFIGQLVDDGTIPESVISRTQTSVIRFILVGALLMGLMAFRPQGIFGNREEMVLDDR